MLSKTLFCFPFLIHCCCSDLSGQVAFPEPSTASMLGMANNGLHSTQADALMYNPAGLSFLTQTTLIFSGVNYWGLEDFNIWHTGLAAPLRAKDAIGIQFMGFTPGNFSYLVSGIAYARQLSGSLAMGIQGHFHQIAPGTNYSRVRSVGATLGLQVQLTTGIRISALLSRAYPFQEYGSLPAYYPDTYKLGILVHPVEAADMTLEIRHSLYTDPEISWGIAYRFFREKALWRMGINWTKQVFTTGFGWNFLGLSMDISTLYQAQLGFTQALSLTYKIGKKDGNSAD